MICNTCGQPANYIHQYSRYYCYNCQKYVEESYPGAHGSTPQAGYGAYHGYQHPQGYGAPAGYGPMPGYTQPWREPQLGWPIAAAMINGVVALLMGFLLLGLDPLFGMILILPAIFLIGGGALLGSKQYTAAAVLCFIGGVLTIPMGFLGVYAGSKAWTYSKY